MRKLLLTLLLVVASRLPGAAANETPQSILHYYSTLDGLSHDHVSDIFTDSRGFVWICTWYGVSRFDGYSFRNFPSDANDNSTLSHHRFVSVSEDSCGHLWFTTYNFHVYRLNRYTEQFEDVLAAVPDLDPNHYRMTCVAHDRAGATWIAVAGYGLVCLADTPDAEAVRMVARYDRTTLGGEVAQLHVDAGGTVWVASSNGLLSRIRTAEQERIERLADLGGEVVRLVESRDKIYAMTSRALVEVDRVEGGVTRYAASTPLTAMSADTLHQTLYVGDASGMLYHLTAEGLSRLRPAGAPLRRIRDLATDSHGTLWVTTTEAGITRYNPSTNDCKHFSQAPNTVAYNLDTLTRIVEGGGRLWVKMNQYGFGYYDRARDRILPFHNDPHGLDNRMTNCVVRVDAREDALWLTTYYERGLWRATFLTQPADVFTIDAAEESGSTPFRGEVRALMTDSRGRIWVGTRDGELLAYDSDYRPVYRLPECHAGMIYALKEDSRGAIWVGTKGAGLYRLTPDGERFRLTRYLHSEADRYSLSDDQVYSIEEDAAGRIWVATYGGGVNILESPESRRFIHAGNLLAHYPIDEAGRVRYLLHDRADRMLIATVDGLLVADPSASYSQMPFRMVQRIPGDTTSLANNDIIHMLKDSHDRIWLATYGGGLNLLTEYDAAGNPRFRRYGAAQGLASNICMALTEDAEGDLWISTHSAVSHFDPATERFSTYLLYDDMRAAQLSEATALTAPDGKVLFGGGRHLYRFDPAHVGHAVTDYRLRFTGLEVGNRAVVPAVRRSPLKVAISEADEIRLPYDFANFRIEFAALNHALQQSVGYMYRLEGYDRDWNIAGSTNSAAYSNLPIGDYRLRVKAFTGSTEAADEGISMRIRVVPPLWLTWWAKMLYLLLALAILFVVLRMLNSVMRIRREARVEQNMTDLKLSFFTNISHELRTPLTLILGGIEDVRSHDQLSTRGDLSLTLAYRNAKRMLMLINQLLDFRKIVKNKMELKIARIDLVPMVEDALEDFRKLAADRHIELLFTLSRRSILLWVDAERIESVLYNLLSNALKFTPAGGRIEVILTQRDEEECVTLTVRDTGIGIPRDKQEAIFERFVQASRAVDSNMHGSGIGLSLCRDIVTLHHGEISVESRPGEGAAFTVKLKMGNAHFGMEQIDFSTPAADGKKPDYMVSDFLTDDSQRRTDVTPPKGAQKILLVEDNHELRIFLYNRLIESYFVVEAEDGIDALEKIRTEQPDIIITDLMMPRMDGIELIDKVRHDFSMSHLPIVMLTAKHSPDDRVKAMEYGADGYITKPFSIELLLARIDNLLTQRRNLFERYSAQSARNKRVELSVGEVVVTDRDEAFMADVMTWLGENIENSDLTVDSLASHLALGRTTLYNKLKSLTGKSPVELIKEYRLTKAKMLLRTGQFSVSEAAYKVGFSDPGYFSRCFREMYHLSPAEYMKSHHLKQKHEDTNQHES